MTCSSGLSVLPHGSGSRAQEMARLGENIASVQLPSGLSAYVCALVNIVSVANLSGATPPPHICVKVMKNGEISFVRMLTMIRIKRVFKEIYPPGRHIMYFISYGCL